MMDENKEGGGGGLSEGEEGVADHITSLTKWTLSHFLAFLDTGKYSPNLVVALLGLLSL